MTVSHHNKINLYASTARADAEPVVVRQKSKSKYRRGYILTAFSMLLATLPLDSQAKPKALLNAEHEFSKVLPLCLEANRERRKKMLDAQNFYLDYETQYKAILEKVPEFAQEADASIREQIAFCKNVKKTIDYEMAKLDMYQAIQICQSVENAFRTNNLVQAENLLTRYAQQKERIVRSHPQVLSFADIKAETVRCDKRITRAERWRELINQTTQLIRSQANCEELATNLTQTQPMLATEYEKAQVQLAQTENLLARVQGQVSQLLTLSTDFSPQAMSSYENGVTEIEACIATVSRILTVPLAQQSKPIPKVETQNRGANKSNSNRLTLKQTTPEKRPTRAITKPPSPQIQESLSSIMTMPSPDNLITRAEQLKKRCLELIDSANAMRISPKEFEILGRAKAQFIIALEQINPMEHSIKSRRDLDRCAVDLSVAFVTAEATLLETTQPQTGPKIAPKQSPLLEDTPDTNLNTKQADPKHPLLKRLRNLRIWRKENADQP